LAGVGLASHLGLRAPRDTPTDIRVKIGIGAGRAIHSQALVAQL